jgi:hypothetical protein
MRHRFHLSTAIALASILPAQANDADLGARANRLCAERPLSVAAELQSALMRGDQSFLAMLADSARKVGIAPVTVSRLQEDAGRTGKAYGDLTVEQRRAVIDSLQALESGTGVGDMASVVAMTASFPDYPGSYRKSLLVAWSFESLRGRADESGKLQQLLDLATNDGKLLRDAGFYRLYAQLCTAALDAAQIQTSRIQQERDGVPKSVASALKIADKEPLTGGRSGDTRVKQPSLDIMGTQSAEMVVLGESEKPHTLSGDYVIGPGQTLVLEAGSIVRMKPEARIVVQAKGSLIVRGKAADGEWVQLQPFPNKPSHGGIRIEADGAATIHGIYIVGASTAISKTGGGDVTVEDSVLRQCGTDGQGAKSEPAPAINFLATGNVIMRNCLIEDSVTNAFALSSTAPILESCTIKGSGRHGVAGGYYAKPKMTLCLFDGNNEYGIFLDDRSGCHASFCSFAGKNKRFDVYLDRSPEASSFEQCWWGSGSVSTLREIASGKSSNLGRLRDGRDVGDGSTAVALFPGPIMDKNPGEKVGYHGPTKIK